jgi:pimeloyl-ACP methyl ester carboxylesterase
MKKKLTIRGLDIFYRQEGQGPPLILLHGWGRSGEVFSTLQSILARNFCVFALDLPGFGQSPLPEKIWGVKEYARLVAVFCRRLGLKKFSLLGHSFGGRIALQLAARKPQKVEKLVLTGVPVLRKTGFKRTLFWLVAKFSNLILFLPPLCFLKNPLRRLFYFLIKEHDYQRARGQLRKIFKKVIRHRPKKALGRIKVPTLVIWGSKDQVTPLENARFLKEKIKSSRLKVVANASHKLPYEEPIKFSQKIISFLKN